MVIQTVYEDFSLIESPFSGWADYVDTQYTSGSPLALVANTDTNLPNNAGTIRNAHLPSDIAQFYDGTKILGVDGDAYLWTLDFKVTPTNANTTYLETWIDIGGEIGELYRRIVTFPKGNGVERSVTHTTANVYDIRHVLFRLHNSRGA
jgi:hypothetical protein